MTTTTSPITDVWAAYTAALTADPRLSPATVDAYRWDARRFLGWLACADLTLPALRPALVRAFLDAERAEGLKPATVDRRRSALVHLCDWLIVEAHLWGGENPARAIDPAERSALRVYTPLTDEEVARLLAAAGAPHHGRAPWLAVRNVALIQLILSTGVTSTEAGSLRWSDLTSDAAGTWLTVEGAHARERRVPVPEDALAALRAYRTAGRALRARNAHALFPSERGEWLDRQSVQYIMRHVGLAAGIRLTATNLRATFTRRALAAGHDPHQVAAWLGTRDLRSVDGVAQARRGG
jgi:site-specific recombinase XerD